MKVWSYILIITAAILWGLTAFFVKGLAAAGFTALQIVAIRVGIGAAILFLYLFITNKKLLKVRILDCKYFIGTGVLGIVISNSCFFAAMEGTTVAVATILLYSAPAFVVILSRIFLKEALTKTKVIALLATLAGCALVVGLFPNFKASVPLYSLLIGLGAGLGYAQYNIYSKFALTHYQPMTVTVYTFIFAAAAMLPSSGVLEASSKLLSWPVFATAIGLGLFSTVLPYTFYLMALSHIEPSRASIASTLEVIVGTLVGSLIFNEPLSGWQILGIAVVIIAVISAQRKPAINQQIISESSNPLVLGKSG